MSDIGPTEPLPSSRSGTTPRAASPAAGSGTASDDLRVERTRREPHDLVAETSASKAEHGDGANPLEAVQRPDNRAKLLLGTAALTLLNLLLLLAVLANVTGPDYEPINVDGAPCVIETGGDESILYCQR